ncbi:hypothetical protein CAL7716_060300 [Calothrix sp. PCC 7716]|nr:hypothetical protein CAL7716_060300 [Calothrix sp. PCC 7716]
MTASAPIFQVFSYSEFPNQDSEALAKDTFVFLVAFARNYFDGLIEIGSKLCNVLEEILKSDKNGKKVFSKWLGSFGALEYLARNAIDIYNWFKALDPELQQELRENVQSLKISALRELRYLTPEQLKEFITSGKRTAKQIKQLHARSTKKAVKNTNGARLEYQNNDLDSFEAIEEQPVVEVIECDVELAPDFRVSKSKKIYSQEEFEAKLAETLAQKERELEEKKIGRFVEVEEAAKKSAGAELDSYKKRTAALEQRVTDLLHLLDAKEQELRELPSLQARNEQLEQRVTDLEKICENSNKNLSNANRQATEQPKADLILLLPRLMSEAHELREVVSAQKKELAQLHGMNLKQQEEITEWRLSSEQSTNIEAIVKEFGTLGESIGWNGWNRYGYRAADGTLYRNLDAITNFISDLKQAYYEETSLVFH